MAKDADNTGNLWDALFGEIGRAVADAREKVVLEPWFGHGSGDARNPATHSVAEELGWVRSERENAAPAAPTHGHDHGSDFER